MAVFFLSNDFLLSLKQYLFHIFMLTYWSYFLMVRTNNPKALPAKRKKFPSKGVFLPSSQVIGTESIHWAMVHGAVKRRTMARRRIPALPCCFWPRRRPPSSSFPINHGPAEISCKGQRKRNRVLIQNLAQSGGLWRRFYVIHGLLLS